MSTTIIYGQLEIDHVQGVIRFYRADTQESMFRVTNLPTIPIDSDQFLDVTFGIGVSWRKKNTTNNCCNECGRPWLTKQLLPIPKDDRPYCGTCHRVLGIKEKEEFKRL